MTRSRVNVLLLRFTSNIIDNDQSHVGSESH